MPEFTVPPEEIEYSLRRVRAATYRIEVTDTGATLALVMNASAAARRNAAAKIIGLLIEHGLALDVAEPVDSLTEDRAGYPVVRR